MAYGHDLSSALADGRLQFQSTFVELDPADWQVRPPKRLPASILDEESSESKPKPRKILPAKSDIEESDLSGTAIKTHNQNYIRHRGSSNLHLEPYRSELEPLLHFRDPILALTSSQALYDKFLHYKSEGDFAGMDMARKFIQVGHRVISHDAKHDREKACIKEEKTESSSQQIVNDEKAKSAGIFEALLKSVKKDEVYVRMLKERRALAREARNRKKEMQKLETEGADGVGKSEEDLSAVDENIAESDKSDCGVVKEENFEEDGTMKVEVSDDAPTKAKRKHVSLKRYAGIRTRLL